LDTVALKAEIDSDPLGRGYAGMTDRQVADDLNTFYREGTPDPGAMFQYLAENKAKDGVAATATTILGRMQRLSRATGADIGTKFFQDDGNAGQSADLTMEAADSGRALFLIAEQDRLQGFVGNTNRLNNMLNDVRLAGCLKAADRDAILAMSQNKQSRAGELGIGRATEGAVQRARALP